MPPKRSKEEIRNSRRELVERLLASGMDVKPWCSLNGVCYQTMYEWLAYFRDNDPDVFGGYDIAHAGDGSPQWFRRVREAMRQGAAIVPSAAGGQLASFAVVDTAGIAGPRPSPGAVVTVRFAGVEVEVPAGCADELSAVIRAAVSL